MRVEMKVTGLDATLATLRSLPAEIVSKKGGPVKLALANGARKLRDFAKQNLRAAIAHGPTTRSTGNLLKNVVATRGKSPTGGKGERYLVRIKGDRLHPYLNADNVRTNPRMTANLMEYGSSHQPATPWLRPAVVQHGSEIITTITTDLDRRLQLTVTKLAAQNKGRG